MLPNGGRLLFHNYDRSDVSVTYSHDSNRESNKLGTWYINGDTIYIEYYQSEGTEGPLELEVASIIHGYRLGRVDDLINGNGTRQGIE